MSKKIKYYVTRGKKVVFESFDASEALQWAVDNGAEAVAGYYE